MKLELIEVCPDGCMDRKKTEMCECQLGRTTWTCCYCNILYSIGDTLFVWKRKCWFILPNLCLSGTCVGCCVKCMSYTTPFASWRRHFTSLSCQCLVWSKFAHNCSMISRSKKTLSRLTNVVWSAVVASCQWIPQSGQSPLSSLVLILAHKMHLFLSFSTALLT